MTDRDSGPAGEPAPERDPEEQHLASLLADLADDPDAPPSTVSAASVLAAVRAQAPAADAAGPVPTLDVSTPDVSTLDVSALDVSAGSDGTVVDGRHRFQGRRRAVLVGVLAAACLAAVSAVVIPLSLRSSDTATSAGSAPDSASAAVAGQAGQVPGQSAADQSAAGSAAGSALVQTPEAASGQADAALPGEPPAPTDAGGNAASSAGCVWSPLSADAATALTRSLPPGRFAAPGELVTACAAEPVAGARLPDSTGGSLVVTVVTAKPGAARAARRTSMPPKPASAACHRVPDAICPPTPPARRPRTPMPTAWKWPSARTNRGPDFRRVPRSPPISCRPSPRRCWPRSADEAWVDCTERPRHINLCRYRRVRVTGVLGCLKVRIT